MSEDTLAKVELERKALIEARERGGVATLFTYFKLSGPGWLQSALTLGGGSLSSSLYLGVLAGFSLLWLQPLAMILGIIMLSAIGYVTLTTRERPFQAINRHVNPVLGWGWALASLLANMVWALPQYALANGVIQQNLFPGLLGAPGDRYLIVGAILVFATAVTWSYDRGGWGIRFYERALKLMVALIVACFVLVVIRLGLSEQGLQFGAIFSGFVPDFGAIFTPAPRFEPLLAAIPDTAARGVWSDMIVSAQRDVLVSAAATAVGINMTFLFPYSLLKRGWGKNFRGLVKFDLGTGMLIPFVLATSCVVIASASQFHTREFPGLLGEKDAAGVPLVASPKAQKSFTKLLESRVSQDLTAEGATLGEEAREAEIARRVAAIGPEERRVAATLVSRDAGDLAAALRPLTGDIFANILFGIGVLAMALSTITLLMLISGFVICEIFNLPQGGWYHRLGCLAAATGVLGPFLWGENANFYVAIPTSVFGFMLLPIAYLTFFLLMNRKSLLGEEMPSAGRRLAWNLAMGIATLVSGAGALGMIWIKGGWWGMAAVGLFVVALGFGHASRGSGTLAPRASGVGNGGGDSAS